MISCELARKPLAFYANLLALSESPTAFSVCISNAISKAFLRGSAKHTRSASYSELNWWLLVRTSPIIAGKNHSLKAIRILCTFVAKKDFQFTFRHEVPMKNWKLISIVEF